MIFDRGERFYDDFDVIAISRSTFSFANSHPTIMKSNDGYQDLGYAKL